MTCTIKQEALVTAYKYSCHVHFHTLAFFLLRQEVTFSDSESYIQHMSKIFFIMTQSKAMTDVLKELKEKMATLVSKIDEIQQAQVTGSSHIAKEGEGDDDEDSAKNLVILTESMQAFLEAAFLQTQTAKSRWSVKISHCFIYKINFE